MTHLYIELNTGLTEEVNSTIISKLYNIVVNNELDNRSDLIGRLHSITGYENEASYLRSNFNNLYISIDKELIFFKDKNLEKDLITTLSGYNVSWANLIVADQGFTRETAALVEDNYLNLFWRATDWSKVTSFMELGYFSKIVNGLTVDFSNLEEIDCSNIKSFGLYSLKFTNATKLRTFIYNPLKVEHCEGNIFENCSSLNIDINFPNCLDNCDNAFLNSGIERILNVGPGTTKLRAGLYSSGAFNNCNKLKYISLNKECIGTSAALTAETDGYMFRSCSSLECIIFNCPQVFLISSSNHFQSTNNTFKIYVPDSLVTNYRTDTYWSSWSSRIFGISQLLTDNLEYYLLWYNYSGVEHNL